MFAVKVQHRDSQAQVMHNTFKQRWQAEKFAAQQIEIARTNGRKVFEMGNEFVVLAQDSDVRESTFWVVKVTKNA